MPGEALSAHGPLCRPARPTHGGSTLSELVKVSSRSNPHAVAGVVAAAVRTIGSAELQVVGAGALNQAIKAVVIAGSIVGDGADLACRPAFTTVEIDGEERTAIRIRVDLVRRTGPSGPAGSAGPAEPPGPAQLTVATRPPCGLQAVGGGAQAP